MTSPKPMSKLVVLGRKRDMEEVIDELHAQGAYHIEEHTKNDLDIGEPLESAEEIDEALVTAKSILSSWDVDEEVDGKPEVKLSNAVETIKEIEEKNRQFVERKRTINERLRFLEKAKETLRLLEKHDIKPEYIDGLRSVKGFVGRVDSTEGLEKALDDVSSDYEMESEEDFVAVFVPREESNGIRKTLQGFGFESVETEGIEEYESAEEVETDIEGLEEDLEEVREAHQELNDNYRDFLVRAEKTLRIASEKAEAPLNFAVSDHTFYINGYVPKDTVDQVREGLEEVTNSRIDVREEDIEDSEEVPIELNHKKPVEDFEFFMDLYSLPKYVEVDPTMLTFITFPMLFGFMLGDMGYGVTTLLLFLGLKPLLPKARGFLNILIASSIWTIVFGALFGEVFGLEEIGHFHLPHVLSRAHDVNMLLYASVALGVLHVNLGLIVGFYNELKRHGWFQAIMEKGGWFVLEAAAALFGISYLWGAVPMWYGYVALAASVIMLGVGEGVKGIVEIPSLFSNILSYARLMAIGLASIGLAGVVNDFAGPMFHQGVGGIIGATLILVIGHSINIALGLFGPFLHSLRLHYVEFFTKFYEGGGKPFKPFGTRR